MCRVFFESHLYTACLYVVRGIAFRGLRVQHFLSQDYTALWIADLVLEAENLKLF